VVEPELVEPVFIFAFLFTSFNLFNTFYSFIGHQIQLSIKPIKSRPEGQPSSTSDPVFKT
jgi:hypothetical protein